LLFFSSMDLLTVQDVAKELEISVWRVHQLIKEQRLPAQKLGSQYVIKESDLALVRERKVGRPKKQS
jgi:excisionase family DNA binding protein